MTTRILINKGINTQAATLSCTQHPAHLEISLEVSYNNFELKYFKVAKSNE